MIAVCSEIHTKHVNTLCRQKVELLNVKLVRIYSNLWAVKASDAKLNVSRSSKQNVRKFNIVFADKTGVITLIMWLLKINLLIFCDFF